jgi:hypothetical protein
LEYLARKGGFYGKFEEIEQQMTVTTYESSKSNMDYEEYKNLVGEKKDV